MAISWEWSVPQDFSKDTGRADQVLLKAIKESGILPDCTRAYLHKLISQGHVTQNSQTIKRNSKLIPGSKIMIQFPEPTQMEIQAEKIPIEILYEDEHLIVVNKAQGISVHPSEAEISGTLVNALLYHIPDLQGIGGVLRPGIVHRIDKFTSGALVVSKTNPTHQALSDLFSRRLIQRQYWALCYGAPQGSQEIQIETQMGRNPKDRKKMSTDVKIGKNAITLYSKDEEYSDQGFAFASFLKVRLKTGRTHQIRVHLTAEKHSILGDPVYGKPSLQQSKWTRIPSEVQEKITQLPGQALHARSLGFTHPITGKDLFFEAEPPKEFRDLLEELRKYKV